MVMALKWVRQNIESFGGDRNSVTLMGSSSGSASIHILALSKKTDGLFDKYILHSGTALTPWAVHPKNKIREISESVANYLGCPTILDVTNSLITNSIVVNDNNVIKEDWNFQNATDTYHKMDLEMIRCMRSFDAESILIALSHHYSQHKHPYCVFVPTIEDDSSDAILTMHPIEIIEKKLFRDIPGIMGVVNDEGLLKTHDFYVDSEMLRIFIDEFDTILPMFLEMPYVVNNVHGFVNAIKDFYFDDNNINTQLQKITEMTGDGIFIWSVYKSMNYLSQVMKSNLYLFYFNYFGTFSNTQDFRSKPLGISHSDDIKYFFPSPKYDSSFNTKSDTIMIHVLSELWSNFIKNGVPSTWSVPNWPAYRNHQEFMLFNGDQEVNITIENNFFIERMNFWNNLMHNYSDKFPKWYLYNENINDKHNSCYHLQFTKYLYFLTIFTIIWIFI